jgi:hypothetical protein
MTLGAQNFAARAGNQTIARMGCRQLVRDALRIGADQIQIVAAGNYSSLLTVRVCLGFLALDGLVRFSGRWFPSQNSSAFSQC